MPDELNTGSSTDFRFYYFGSPCCGAATCLKQTYVKRVNVEGKDCENRFKIAECRKQEAGGEKFGPKIYTDMNVTVRVFTIVAQHTRWFCGNFEAIRSLEILSTTPTQIEMRSSSSSSGQRRTQIRQDVNFPLRSWRSSIHQSIQRATQNPAIMNPLSVRPDTDVWIMFAARKNRRSTCRANCSGQSRNVTRMGSIGQRFWYRIADFY